VAQDNQEAVRWFRKAAEQGNAYAQGTLGVLYYNGTGVAQDYQEAVRWYRKAAEQGNPAAQGNLGGVYSTGQGVAQDYVEAWMWLSLAVMRSDGDDRKKWAAARAAVAQKITPQQVTEAERRVREWKPAEGSPSESISPMPAAAPAAPAGTPVTAAAPSFAPKRAGSALAAGPRPAVAVKRPCFLVRSSNGTFSANGKELFWTVRYTTAGCPESEFPLNVRVTLHFRNKAEVEVGTLVSPLDAVVLAAGTVPSKSLIKAKPVGVAGPNELVHGHVSVPKEIFRQTFTLGATAEVLK
jgi:hypothetical protein